MNFTKELDEAQTRLLRKLSEPIGEATGQWDEMHNEYSANYSSMLSFLITQTGRFVEGWASDLFVTWNAVERDWFSKRDEPVTNGTGTWYGFGLRKDGVDGFYQLLCKVVRNNSPYSYSLGLGEYRKVYLLNVEGSERDIKMKLYEVNT